MANNNDTINQPLALPDKEVALGDLLSTLLTNDNLHDVTLKGTDGVLVACHRAILATRSPVFQKILFGKFSEASQKVVEIGFKGEILKAVVEYIYTDEPQILNKKKRKSSESIGNKSSKVDHGFDMEWVEILLSLADASNIFHLPGLLEKASAFLSHHLSGCETAASIDVLEALMKVAPTAPESLVDAAMKRVREDTEFTRSGCDNLTHVSNSVLELILRDRRMEQTEQELFLILQEWADVDPKQRKPVATDLTKYIHLENIDPVALENKVTDSGLVYTRRLLEAYRNHSLWAWKPSLDKFRANTTLWQNSGSTITAAKGDKYSENFELDLLKVSPIKSGDYEWKIGILSDSDGDDNLCSTIWLGIASAGMQIDSAVHLGLTEGGWSISDYGSKYTEGSAVHHNEYLDFYSGMKVTLKLSLSDLNGCLKMSTANSGGEEAILFVNLCDHLKKTPGGFLPAVSTGAPGRVRILEFTKLKD